MREGWSMPGFRLSYTSRQAPSTVSTHSSRRPRSQLTSVRRETAQSDVPSLPEEYADPSVKMFSDVLFGSAGRFIRPIHPSDAAALLKRVGVYVLVT